MKPKIYICGKVTGLELEEITEKFKKVEAILLHKNFEAINPVTVVNNPVATWNEAMKACIAALMSCDALIALPCAKYSKGAQLEIALANETGIPVFDSLWQLTQHFKHTIYDREDTLL